MSTSTRYTSTRTVGATERRFRIDVTEVDPLDPAERLPKDPHAACRTWGEWICEEFPELGEAPDLWAYQVRICLARIGSFNTGSMSPEEEWHTRNGLRILRELGYDMPDMPQTPAGPSDRILRLREAARTAREDE